MTHPQVTAALPAAAIGNHFGYRFLGDTVELNADIQCYSPAHAGLDWALQLWSDDSIKIAELALGQLFPDNHDRIQVSGTTPAMLPAGGSSHRLSLRLVSGFSGIYDCLHDQRNFEVMQEFRQPRLCDPVECRLDGDELVMAIAAIENPREADNLSGTLTLELWSLDTPYSGGAWVGTRVSNLVIGCLNGQTGSFDCHYTAHAEPIPEGGHLTLMLREWTDTGYVTRDYRSLPTLPSGAGRSAGEQAASPGPAETPSAPASPPNLVSPPAPEESPAPDETASAEQLSVNQASAEEIRALKGISRNVASAIVDSRPFESLDDLLRVKGIGPRLLDKVRRFFRL